MHRDYRLYLDDILDAIDRISEYVEGMDDDAFISDRKTQDAVIRNLEIIGEASRNLSDELKAQSNEIEWTKIIGFRNILAHEYFGVSIPIVWDIVQNKLGPLREVCTKLLNELEKTWTGILDDMHFHSNKSDSVPPGRHSSRFRFQVVSGAQKLVFLQPVSIQKWAISFKVKEGEDFNQRNTLKYLED